MPGIRKRWGCFLAALAVGLSVLGLWQGVERVRLAAAQGNASGQFCQLQLAIHNYHNVHGKLPGPIRDKAGQPLLSWRVTILPFIEGDALHKEFHLDEPWDSPHNLTLLKRMPSS